MQASPRSPISSPPRNDALHSARRRSTDIATWPTICVPTVPGCRSTMLLDTENIEDGSLLEAKVIIAGGGMAGLLLARQLADAGADVIVLESGGQSPDSRVQSLYAGKMTLGGPGNAERNMD